MTLPRAVNAPELLDEPRHDERELEQSLGHVAAVNRWIGGTRALLAHVTPLLHEERRTRLLDVGTGSADLPRAIAEWARRQQRRVVITATDLHPQTLAIARRRCAAYGEIAVEPADVLRLPYPDNHFDVATMSLTLHHFDGAEQQRALAELARVCAGTIIVNELRRTRLNYFGARFLGMTLWRGNRLTRHDGPLSVLRAFTPRELRELARTVGLDGHTRNHWFQRVIMTARKRRHHG